MKRISILLVTVASLLTAGAASATALTPPGQGKIQCFNVAPGTCTLNTSGAKGSATLDTRRGGVAGVYIPGSNGSFYGVRLSRLKTLSFTHSGTAGVDPHWSIPIDIDNNGSAEFFALVASNSCSNGAGLVDVINDTTCTIFRSDDTTAAYENWGAFATSTGNPWVAHDSNLARVVADRSLGIWTVSNVTVGKPGA